jgi:hypothetical protein
MKLPFRHGIAKYTLDANNAPKFLYSDKREKYVSLTASNNAVLFTVAHHDVDYLYEEKLNVNNAWGPFERDIKYWMYWDLSLRTGRRSFGATQYEPIASYDKPTDPYIDQHWFDMNVNCMKWYDGDVWITCLRIFAGTYSNGDVTAYPLSSQVDLFMPCHAGFIMYDDSDTPTQRARHDGSYKFLTTESHFYDEKAVTTTVSLQPSIHYAYALTDLPKYTIIALDADNKIRKASSDDMLFHQAVGVVRNDVGMGEQCSFVTNSYITNPNWDWNVTPSSPIFLGINGTIRLTPPDHGFIQRLGFVVSPNTVYIDTSYQIIYHNDYQQKDIVPVMLDATTGRFYTAFSKTNETASKMNYKTFCTTYKQTVPNYTWILYHDSNLENYIVQVYDDRGIMITPHNIQKHSRKSIAVTFHTRSTGTANLFLF